MKKLEHEDVIINRGTGISEDNALQLLVESMVEDITLSVRDIISVCKVSTRLNKICKDGVIWDMILQRQFPNSWKEAMELLPSDYINKLPSFEDVPLISNPRLVRLMTWRYYKLRAIVRTHIRTKSYRWDVLKKPFPYVADGLWGSLQRMITLNPPQADISVYFFYDDIPDINKKKAVVSVEIPNVLSDRFDMKKLKGFFDKYSWSERKDTYISYKTSRDYWSYDKNDPIRFIVPYMAMFIRMGFMPNFEEKIMVG